MAQAGRRAKRFKVVPTELVLGGHSYGGGMAMAYAARIRACAG